MKPILLLLLTCLPLCAATTYPVLSDNTNRTITGGTTNLSFLNSNSVFTGTARWMGIVTLTNTGNIFVGDGAGLTGVGIATSGGLATNATIYGLTINTGSTNNALTGSRAMVTDANKGIISSATTATELGYVSGVTSALQTQINAAPTLAFVTNSIYLASYGIPTGVFLTNAGDFGLLSGGGFATVTMPALTSTASVWINIVSAMTNANLQNTWLAFWAGPQTNFMGVISIKNTAAGNAGLLANVFANIGSASTQLCGTTGAVYPQLYNPQPLVDTSTNGWKLYCSLIPAAVGTTNTNWFVGSFKLIVAP